MIEGIVLRNKKNWTNKHVQILLYDLNNNEQNMPLTANEQIS